MRLSRDLITTLLLILGSVSAIAQETKHSAGDKSDLQELIEQIQPSVATIRVEGRDGDELSIGTGFVIDEKGLIATNYHVINEGRNFTVQLSGGEKLKPLVVEASDRQNDLALIRVELEEGKLLPSLSLAGSDPKPGTRVLAFGNPLGLDNSVVDGMVSAVREVQGREMIQLAIPIEQGNSGGPLVNRDGNVLGIINMKSAIDDNLGFAIPINRLIPLREKPNPIAMDRWVRFGGIDSERWTPILGATWQERGGQISARGSGKSFGGRSLCLSTKPLPELPFEIAVTVKLDDESGAAGLAFRSDGENKHYGFYPSNGRIRLTCFKGATVYSWEVLEEIETEHYLPKQWNRLRLRFEKDKVQCFVNGHLVVTSRDKQLTGGKVGLVKFRTTRPDFRGFEIDADLSPKSLSNASEKWFAKLDAGEVKIAEISTKDIGELGESGDAAARALVKRAYDLEEKAKQVRRLAEEVRRVPTITSLKKLLKNVKADKEILLRATLLIAQLDHPEIDIDFYLQRVDAMADEIRGTFKKGSSETQKRELLDEYLFRQNGFHGGRSEYYHPANSHMNRVIDDREGLPITLSVLYIELGRRLGLKIQGVGLPGHFVVKHVTKEDEQLIDVFESGKLMTRDDAAMTVMQYAERRLREEDLRAQTDIEILTRVLSNLMGIATQKEDLESMLRYMEAIVAINPDSVDFRMMRIQLRAMTDRKSRALEDIDWLMASDLPGVDPHRLERIRQALLD